MKSLILISRLDMQISFKTCIWYLFTVPFCLLESFILLAISSSATGLINSTFFIEEPFSIVKAVDFLLKWQKCSKSVFQFILFLTWSSLPSFLIKMEYHPLSYFLLLLELCMPFFLCKNWMKNFFLSKRLILILKVLTRSNTLLLQ